MSDRIWAFHDVIAEVLDGRGLRMQEYSRIIWRTGQPRDTLVSSQEYRLLLRDESGQQSRVPLLIDDDTTDASV